jgi:hypothetical protein
MVAAAKRPESVPIEELGAVVQRLIDCNLSQRASRRPPCERGCEEALGEGAVLLDNMDVETLAESSADRDYRMSTYDKAQLNADADAEKKTTRPKRFGRAVFSPDALEWAGTPRTSR